MVRGAVLTQQDRQIIRRSTWICWAVVAEGVGLLLLGGLTWSTDAFGGLFGLVAGAAFVVMGLRIRRLLRTSPEQILRNHAALEERDRQLPFWRHAWDWLALLLTGAAGGAWMLAGALAVDYGPALTAAWSAVAAVFFVSAMAMLAWHISRFRRSRRALT